MSWISNLGEWLDDNIWQPIGEGINNAGEWISDKVGQFDNWLDDTIEDIFGKGNHRNDLDKRFEEIDKYLDTLDVQKGSLEYLRLKQQLRDAALDDTEVGHQKFAKLLSTIMASYAAKEVITNESNKNKPIPEEAVLASGGRNVFIDKNPKQLNSGVSDSVTAISNNVGNNSQSNQASQDNNGLWSSLKNLLLGDTSLSANGSSLLSMLAGVGSQYASSVLNYDNQVRLIDKQNAYNTPKAQMERFADAGLNPNLVYGLGSNGNQPASGSISPVDFDTSQRENRMAQLQFGLAVKQAAADIGLKQAQTRSAAAQSDYVNEQAIAQRNTNSIFGIIKQQYAAQLDQQINLAIVAKAQANTEPEKRAAEIALLRAQKAKEEFLSHSQQGQFAIDIRNFFTNLPSIGNDIINDLGNSINSTFGK